MVLEKSFFTTGYTSWCRPHVWGAVSNSSKSYFLTHNPLIQLHNLCAHLLHKTQHNNLHSKLCSSLKTYMGEGKVVILGPHHYVIMFNI